ncbi:MAG: hypothetical protein EXS05_04920 [Planctomycetaceae bacterium]|nr:hypothetical protein [Planctomycetaceae bacterium]
MRQLRSTANQFQCSRRAAPCSSESAFYRSVGNSGNRQLRENSITAVLKNAIDWASRRVSPIEPALACFTGKVAAIMSASPGALGGLRGLVHLRSILGNIQVLVLPDQIAIVKAHEAFASDGTLKDPDQQATVQRITQKLVATISKLKG